MSGKPRLGAGAQGSGRLDLLSVLGEKRPQDDPEA